MFNKNISIPFLGISMIVAVGLIWAAVNFFNIGGGADLKNQNIPSVGFDVAALEADQKNLDAAELNASFLDQDEALFAEIDMASNNISGISDSALDEKSLTEEAQAADISQDLNAVDNGTVQNEIDQSMNDVVQN